MRRLLKWLARVTLARVRKATDKYAAPQPATQGEETITQQVTRHALRFALKIAENKLEHLEGYLHPDVHQTVSYKLRDLVTDLTAPSFSDGAGTLVSTP